MGKACLAVGNPFKALVTPCSFRVKGHNCLFLSQRMSELAGSNLQSRRDGCRALNFLSDLVDGFLLDRTLGKLFLKNFALRDILVGAIIAEDMTLIVPFDMNV